ncbi:MAG: LLM class flavin-dependent oxidoreductase [Actinomycetia bacterium]|nr:LLM class flavin-dependent oxidoreductase [Actinomycetes bacterium]
MATEPLAPWGVMLPNFNPFETRPWPYLDVVRAVEDAGFDAGWVGDHLSFHPPVIETTVALAAAAAVTNTLKLGSAVLLAAMRQPVWLAKSLASIEQMAPGRLLVGVGAGGEHPVEWRAAGAALDHRGHRLDEFLTVLPDLLLGRSVHHPGPHLPIESPPLRPPVSVLPPIIVGGRSQAALRRASRFADGWMGVWLSPERFRRSAERLVELAAEQARPAPEPMLLVFAAIGADPEACRSDAARLFRGQYDLSFEAVEKWTLVGPPGAVAARLAEYRDAGAGSIAVIPARPDLFDQVELIGEVRALLDG